VNSEDKFDANKFREDLHHRIHRDVHERIRAARRQWPHRQTGVTVMWPGIILVILGAAFLLNNMGVIPFDRLWRFWPVILIVVGAIRFVECWNRVMSVMLMLIGSLFLLNNLGYIRFSWGEVWPLILIAVGVSMIFGRMSIPKLPVANSADPNANPNSDPSVVNATTMFGGVERRITTGTFKGGRISATFGGVNLDFRAADIEGEEAVLYVDALFGGIDIVVPERWMVIWEGQSIFGGYGDETRPPLPEMPGAPPKKRLILRGQAMFGGITVKN